MQKENNESAQIALPFVLLISAVIMEIAIAGVLTASFSSNSSLGQRLAVRASAAAYSGVQDALIKISTNKEFAAFPRDYVLLVEDDRSDVSVSRIYDSSTNSYIYTVDSIATAGNRKKKFTATLIVDRTTGQTNLQSILEEPVS